MSPVHPVLRWSIPVGRYFLTRHSMKRILLISHSSLWGGAEKCLYLLLKVLLREQFEPLVLVPGKGALEDAILELGIETRHQTVPTWVRSSPQEHYEPDFERAVSDIVHLIEQERIDVVFSNTSVPIGGALAAQRCRIPHVWHVLEMLSSDPALSPVIGLEPFYRLMNELSERIVAASDSVRADLEQFGRLNNVEVIHTVIEPTDSTRVNQSKQEVFNLPEDTFVVTFVGELSARKGVEDLIRCVPDVLARNSDARFMIVGRDAERGQAVREQLAQNDLGGAVQLLGFRSDIENIMAASDVFVLPTLADPLPLVVQEAMSASTPVVATRSGGCEDMVVEGETGYLVSTSDPKGLATAIISMMDNPEERRRMGENGRKRLQTRFSHQDYIQKVSQLFREVAQQRPPAEIRLSADHMVQLLTPCLEAVTACQALEYKNQELQNLHDAVESSVSTRLGRLLTSPWRGLRAVFDR